MTSQEVTEKELSPSVNLGLNTEAFNALKQEGRSIDPGIESPYGGSIAIHGLGEKDPTLLGTFRRENGDLDRVITVLGPGQPNQEIVLAIAKAPGMTDSLDPDKTKYISLDSEGRVKVNHHEVEDERAGMYRTIVLQESRLIADVTNLWHIRNSKTQV